MQISGIEFKTSLAALDRQFRAFYVLVCEQRAAIMNEARNGLKRRKPPRERIFHHIDDVYRAADLRYASACFMRKRPRNNNA